MSVGIMVELKGEGIGMPKDKYHPRVKSHLKRLDEILKRRLS